MAKKKNKLEKVSFSKQKLINLGYVIVLFNPIPAGIIFGFILRKDKTTKKDGNIMMILSFIWGIVNIALSRKLLGL